MTARKVKALNAWAVVSPVTKGIALWGISSGPQGSRKLAIRYGTVYGGTQPFETWAYTKAKGYEVIPVRITPHAKKKGKANG